MRSGFPAAIVIVEFVPATYIRRSVGILLVLFGIYNLAQLKLPDVKSAGRAADAGVGFCNGILGGSTGLAGVLPMIWCGLRGWNRDEQRAVFQPTGVATFLMSIAAFGGVGFITPDTVRLFVTGLPVLVAGTLLGWALYGKLNEKSFRRVVLSLLLISGILLVTTGRSRRIRVSRDRLGCTAHEKHQKWIDPCLKHECNGSNRNCNGRPRGIGRARHHDPAADDKPYGYGNQPYAHDVLPWSAAESIPQAVGSEVDDAGRPEGRKRARKGSRNSPHFPSDKTHHQDHVRPRDGLRQRKKIAEVLIGHPAMIADNEVANIRQNRGKTAKTDRR